jgi:hypothetical protein
MTKKRVLATFLWFYSGWAMGALIAFFLGVSPALGPIVGIAGAAFIGADPFGRIWVEPKATAGTVGQISLDAGSTPAASSIDRRAA